MSLNNSRHTFKREQSSSLYQLLTYTIPLPVFTKKGTVAKRQPPPHVDKPADFYQALVIHYGLDSSKATNEDKAKAILLTAFEKSGNALQVPANILELEAEMKKLYVKENVVAKKAYEDEEKRREAEEKAKKIRRKRDAEKIMKQVVGSPSKKAKGSKVCFLSPQDAALS